MLLAMAFESGYRFPTQGRHIEVVPTDYEI